MSKEVYFTIDENSDGLIQLSIESGGVGYRICGPKYDGMGRTIKRHKISKRDVAEIRAYLRAVGSSREPL